jgi:hypothetical protein
MAIDHKPLRRCQEWSTDEKRVLSKLFDLAFTAATGSSSIISRKVVNRTLAGKLDAGSEQDIRALFAILRTRIDDTDTTPAFGDHFGSTRWTGNKRRIIKAMAETVVAAIT